MSLQAVTLTTREVNSLSTHTKTGTDAGQSKETDQAGMSMCGHKWACKVCGCTERYVRKTGKTGQCKNCHRRKEKERYALNPEPRKAYARERKRQTKIKKLIVCVHIQAENPELLVEANLFIQKAIRNGTIQPASKQKCADCGKQAKDLHHEDYAKPEEVIPLCRSCHKLRHYEHSPL